jgi:hypothetical protein
MLSTPVAGRVRAAVQVAVLIALLAVPATSLAADVDVVKVPTPLSQPEPGGVFTYSLNISTTNTGPPSGSNLHIQSITDNVYGDVTKIPGSNCGGLLNKLLKAPNQASYSCSFPGTFTGVAGAMETDTVTVVAECKGHGHCPTPTVSGTAQATVSITPPGSSPTFDVTGRGVGLKVDCKGVQPTIIGTGAGELIIGTPGRDVVQAGPGDDTIIGLGGNDRLCGAKGTDVIKGGPGKDALNGGSLHDTCVGGPNKDRTLGRTCSHRRSIP